LTAVSAIRDERVDAEKAYRKARRTAKRAVELEKRERKYDSIPFQGAPVKAEQEIAEKIK